MNILALLKVIESYNKKVVEIFLTKTIHTNKDNCDKKLAEKNVQLCILYDCMKVNIFRSLICTAQHYNPWVPT